MPREYKSKPNGKRYKKYDTLVIEQALIELANPQATIRTVAEKFNISRSVLQRHSTRQMKSQGGQTALTKEEEEHIILNINTCAEWGYPMDVLDLRVLVKSYLDMLGVKHRRFKNNLPGRDFVYNFLKRHKNDISLRLCQNIKRSRAAVSPSTINTYFSELQNSIENVPLNNILNYDETNLSDDPGRHKVLTRRGCKYPERVLNHSKASISLMMAGTAAGELLPPYVVYKSTNIYDSWMKNGPKDARYNRTSSGWFDAQSFRDWVKEIVLPFYENKEGKKVLVGDNLSSHLSTELIDLCKSQDIHFVFLPANSTHLTQPLDVAFFRPMKIAWRQILQKWKKTDGRALSTVPKGCFPRLLKLLMDEINSENNLRAGFRKAGISPFNPNEVLARLPQETVNGEEVKDAIDKSVLNLLKEMRYGSMNIMEPKNKRKINVIAGRSVSNEEMERYAETDPESEIKKKRMNTEKSKKGSLKGKGVGKRTQKKSEEKENKLLLPGPSSGTQKPIQETSEIINAEEFQYQEQKDDWRDMDVENMPVILSENVELYEEIVESCETFFSNQSDVTKETSTISVENDQASTSSTTANIYDNAAEESKNKKDSTNEKNRSFIIDNKIITQTELKKLLPKNQRKPNLIPLTKINNDFIIKKTAVRGPRNNNLYNNSDEILRILESD
ncbi:uncharacterized protein LOC114357630 [Ostrinia furnacalis]|uniref:uncharacterized protein LOC114357630 n=1 Tax=Ostrinia furnacalis TaxID=93504 RepID=UPI00103D4ACC|nr:uncharacterized protein LOC114357630 [Ostrinia furnacalis]